MLGFQPVVEFHLGALDQFIDDAFDVHAGESCLTT